ncbi:MAG TPA: S41 family peptidase, partial [Candidatus Aminicenantes bacterium]|nr:S41 family peptidase [Candidatus Aminicenantes bacterium]
AEVATGKLTRIDHSNRLKNDEFVWEMSDYTWSPDSRWVAYSFVQENRNNRIFLYSLDTGKSTPVTNDFYDCLNPTFDAAGDALYFLSYRNFTARMDLFEDNHVIPDPVRVMVLPLKGGRPPPFRKPKPAGEPRKEPFRIDLAGIESRAVALPVGPGNCFFLKAGKGVVSWAEVDGISEDEYEEVFRPGGADKWTLHLYDLAAEKETLVAGKIGDWRISADGETVLVRSGKRFLLASLKELTQGGKLPGEGLDLDHLTMVVNPVAEWTQIFNDTWRWYRDFFYDPGMHGRDWRKTGEIYRAFIPQLSSRGQLNWLLSQMVGELCVSHTYVGGGDQGPVKLPERPRYVASIGADLTPDASGFYRLSRIYGPTPYDPDTAGPLVRPDWDIREGDFLLAIDGQPVKVPQNPYRSLQVVAGQKVELTIGHQPDLATARTYLVEPLRGDYNLRYNRWLADNIDRTLKESDGQVGYLHVTAMGSGNVAQFDKFWRAFRYKKGLIIDVRGNGGGWTEYFLIDKLERQLVGFNNLKEMSPFRYPNSAGDGRYVVLTDENNGSDGEAFLEHFRARKLGTIVGVPSWGGLVGIINAQQTVDGGVVHQSNNAFYGREGKWWIENHGGDPDIRVENDP